jgi:hypothetical protein
VSPASPSAAATTDLAGDDAELPSAAAWLRRGGMIHRRFRIGCGLRQARDNLPLGAAQIQIDRRPLASSKMMMGGAAAIRMPS